MRGFHRLESYLRSFLPLRSFHHHKEEKLERDLERNSVGTPHEGCRLKDQFQSQVIEARGAQSKSAKRGFASISSPKLACRARGHNGQRARPSSVGRCADRREIPCSEGASSTELIWTVPSLSCVVPKTTVVVRSHSRIAGWPDQPDLTGGRPAPSRRSPLLYRDRG